MEAPLAKEGKPRIGAPAPRVPREGEGKRVHFVSLGCARNRVDSELMLGALAACGWHVTPDPGQAHAIVVNTCSFIRPAIDESIDHILELAHYKTQGSCERLVVTGCLPQRFGAQILSALPEVDLFLGTGAFDRITEALEMPRPLREALLPDPSLRPLHDKDAPRLLTTGPVAYVKISEGCDKACTYCVIPQLRGRQRSRPLDVLVEEARLQAAAGAKEIILVGQDTTAYGRDLHPPACLGGLLDRLAGISQDVWIRFLYGHPEHVDDGLLETVARNPKICPYFDVPVQHASDRVLKAMGRRHCADDLRRLFGTIRTRVPNAVLRSTLLVGFPGETRGDFDRVLSFVEEMRFDHLGVFVYSDMDDLPSHRLPGHVPGKTARRRYDRVMSVQAAISQANNRKHVGKILRVLVSGPSGDTRFPWLGRTWFQAPEIDGVTCVRAEALSPGAWATVRIIEAGPYDLLAEAV